MSPSSLYPSPDGRILVYSTDPRDFVSIRTGFEHDGFKIVTVDKINSLYNLDLHDFDLMLMELPSDATVALHAIQMVKESGSWNTMPLLVFSTSTSSESLVNALNAGADDYIVKPFSIRELAARVRAVLRTARRG